MLLDKDNEDEDDNCVHDTPKSMYALAKKPQMKQIDQLQIATHGCVQFIHLLHHDIIISYQPKNLSAPSLAKTFFI